MNATIVHESRGRIRLRLRQERMTLAQADLLEAWCQSQPWAAQVTVHERTCCLILRYTGPRQQVLAALKAFTWQRAAQTTTLPAHSSRALNRAFEEKLVAKVVTKAACTLFLLSGKIAGISGPVPPELPEWLLCGALGGISVCAVQLFLSLIVRAFSPPVAIGLAGGILGLMFTAQGWGYTFPYSLLCLGMRANNPQMELELVPFSLSVLAYITIFAFLSLQYLRKRDISAANLLGLLGVYLEKILVGFVRQNLIKWKVRYIPIYLARLTPSSSNTT